MSTPEQSAENREPTVLVWHDEIDRLAAWGTLDPTHACMCRDCSLPPDADWYCDTCNLHRDEHQLGAMAPECVFRPVLRTPPANPTPPAADRETRES